MHDQANHADDWTLLQAYAAERSQDAFARLVARYADMVFQTAHRRTRRSDLAEDVTQAVFIALARSAGRLESSGSLAAWLHKAALGASVSALRAETRRRGHERAAAARTDAASAASDSDCFEDQTTTIESALHRLGWADRTILAVHYLEGRTMPDTAEKLGISIEAARKRLTRALSRLRAKLGTRTLTAAALAATLEQISTPTAATASATAASTTAGVVAGGSGHGTVFTLAAELVRAARVLVFKKAVAATLTVAVAACAVEFARHQLASPNTAEAEVVEYPPLPEQKPDPAFATTAPSAPVALPQELRDVLARHAQQLTPITVTWTTRTQSPLSQRHLIHVLQCADWAAKAMLTQRHGTSLSFSDGKYRSWFDDNFPGMVVGGKPQLQYAFDGTHLMIGQDNGLDARGNPQRLVTRFTPENSGHGPDARFVNDEYFTFAGYHLPVTSGELRERRPVRSLIDDLLQNGGTLAAVERIDASGRQLLRLRIFTGERTAKAIHPGPKEGVSVLELDPQLNYALVRSEERTLEGLLYYRLDCADFTRLQGRDLHLPRKITATRFAATVGRPRFYAEPITTTSYDVVEMNTAPIASEQFALKLEPRTTLIEYTPGDGRKHSYVDEAGALKEGFPPTSTGDAGPATKPAAGR